jgi:hypothetical protein
MRGKITIGVSARGRNTIAPLCLWETMKEQFTIAELRGFVGGQSLSWNWTTSVGHSGGGTLDLDVVEMDEGQ